MKKTCCFIAIIMGIASFCLAQKNDLSVIATAAGSGKSSNISLEWTLGEYAVESVYSSNNMYTQGFNQPYLIVAPSYINTVLANTNVYNISIAPNPVFSQLNFNISSSNNMEVLLSVSDVQGKTFIERKASAGSAHIQIDFKNLPAGIYVLSVREALSAHIIKTYQIIRL